MTTKHTPATPLTPVQQFYSTHSPVDAIRLAKADHAANCEPMMPMSDFMRALNKAEERCIAYPKLVEALRPMVRYANAEMGIGWNAPDRAEIDAARALLRELGED